VPGEWLFGVSRYTQLTLIPDAYSNSNEVEDFTQVSVLSLFEIVTPGGLDVSCEVLLKLIHACS